MAMPSNELITHLQAWAALKGEKLTTIRTIKQLARLIEEGTA
jgi:hypothetical protein